VEILSVSPRPNSPADSRSSFSSMNEKGRLLYSGEDYDDSDAHPTWPAVKQVVDCLWILTNTVSTVAIVFINKQ
jgi:hypothetical protein